MRRLLGELCGGRWREDTQLDVLQESSFAAHWQVANWLQPKNAIAAVRAARYHGADIGGTAADYQTGIFEDGRRRA